jgi:DNA gyrase inhibitor GyrI
LIHFADKHNLINNQSIIFTEIIDDVEISDDIHSRYYFSILLDKAFIVPKGKLYRTKTHAQQKYAKFVFTGTDQESAEFYQEIYAFWMTEVNLELTDLPILEFYPNYHEDLPKDQLITEIYIPVK